jgi:hypothetical protein
MVFHKMILLLALIGPILVVGAGGRMRQQHRSDQQSSPQRDGEQAPRSRRRSPRHT